VRQFVLSGCLGLLGCGFHFDDFHAPSDASLAGTRDASDDAAARSPSGASRDAGRPLLDARVARSDAAAPAAPEDAGSTPPAVCDGAAPGSCVCEPAPCAPPVSPPADSPVDAATPAPPPAEPAPQVPGLVLRYDFSGEGASIRDLRGSAHAALNVGALDGSGTLTLDGMLRYVVLPAGLLSSLSSATVASWVESTQAVCWQRVYEFSVARAAGLVLADTELTGELLLTTDECESGRIAAISRRSGQRETALSQRPMTRARMVSLVVVYDAERRRVSLYVDGVLSGDSPMPFALSTLTGDSSWLGRSTWLQDPLAQLRYDEFRIYDRAVSADEVAKLVSLGADSP